MGGRLIADIGQPLRLRVTGLPEVGRGKADFPVSIWTSVLERRGSVEGAGRGYGLRSDILRTVLTSVRSVVLPPQDILHSTGSSISELWSVKEHR